MTRISTMSELIDCGYPKAFEVNVNVQLRRRWTTFEKLAMVNRHMRQVSLFRMWCVRTMQQMPLFIIN